MALTRKGHAKEVACFLAGKSYKFTARDKRLTFLVYSLWATSCMFFYIGASSMKTDFLLTVISLSFSFFCFWVALKAKKAKEKNFQKLSYVKGLTLHLSEHVRIPTDGGMVEGRLTEDDIDYLCNLDLSRLNEL